MKSIAEMYGPSNVSSLNIDQFGQNFMSSQLMGKMVNLSDDMTGGYLDAGSVALLKSLTAGGEILANRKYKDAIPMTCYAKLIFAANDLASMQDRSGAVANRFQIIPLRQDFKTLPDKDPRIAEKMKTEEAQQALIIYGLRGLFRILDVGHFTETTDTEAANREMRAMNSTIVQWLDDDERGTSITDTAVKVAYRDYVEWCENSRVKPVKFQGWQEQVCKAGLFKVIQRETWSDYYLAKKRYRVFVPDDAARILAQEKGLPTGPAELLDESDRMILEESRRADQVKAAIAQIEAMDDFDEPLPFD